MSGTAFYMINFKISANHSGHFRYFVRISNLDVDLIGPPDLQAAGDRIAFLRYRIVYIPA